MKRLAILFVMSTALYAQQAPAPAKPAPTIPAEMRADLYKAQLRIATAQSALERSPEFKDFSKEKSSLEEIVRKINGVCGKGFDATMDKDQNPVCVAKPEPKTEAKTPPKK